MNNILERDIKTLGLNKNLIDKLIENNILNVYKLCSYSRMELSKLKFTNDEINDLIIKMQLLGLDIKKNHAKNNSLIINNGF